MPTERAVAAARKAMLSIQSTLRCVVTTLSGVARLYRRTRVGEAEFLRSIQGNLYRQCTAIGATDDPVAPVSLSGWTMNANSSMPLAISSSSFKLSIM